MKLSSSAKNDMRTTSFWMGAIFVSGINMAYQDWLGKAGYIEQVQSHWLDLHWTVGACLAIFAMCMHVWMRIIDNEHDRKV